MMEDVRVKSNPGMPWQNCIQQEDSFYQQIGLKFEEETSKMLHLEHGFVRKVSSQLILKKSNRPRKMVP
jgi:hypothetical protein